MIKEKTINVPLELFEDLLGFAEAHLSRMERMRGKAAKSGREITRTIVQKGQQLWGECVGLEAMDPTHITRDPDGCDDTIP